MVNKHRGEVALNIGGRERKLRLSMNSLVELQEEFNQPLALIFKELDNFNVKVIRSLLFCALQDDDKSLTREIVGSWDIDLMDVFSKLGLVLSSCLGVSSRGDKPLKK